ncbi:hypothetical protein NQ317_017296 [Molorchus minor]|uniref:Uncharacterized protein n=1 Tax=Molorchus minor TaxID=1323400 RepID=A0ABQ9JU49_9CUCU|nr:hypothetical protein NQ317_017296 [Molorchus minor]
MHANEYREMLSVEELECLAVWKEGSSRYLVGKIHHSHATSNEDRFRCFVYEKASMASEALDGVDYRVAQSGDATCNGLFSAIEGSRTMTLKKASSLNKCRFPFWVANYNHWHTLDYSAAYSFHHRNSTLRITNSSGLEMRVVCVQTKLASRDENSVVLSLQPLQIKKFLGMKCKTFLFLKKFNDIQIVRVRKSHFVGPSQKIIVIVRQNGFSCMSFYRRDAHVMEVQIGSHTKRREDACSPTFFDRNKLPFVTLVILITKLLNVTTSPETRACPYVGKFEVNNLMRNEHGAHPNKYSPDNIYFNSDFYVNRLTRSTHGDADHVKRIKRIDHDVDCDNTGITDLTIGCNNIDTMEFRTGCSAPDFITCE